MQPKEVRKDAVGNRQPAAHMKPFLLALALATSLAVPADTSCAARECCKICKKGKPCGDACIAKDQHCHLPPGCACSG